mmetsp:Transcript_94568/g.276369  ORF Transcript_94568/g.276369 Transcript_94568/m.276369 type:complete len:95 (-) Transcript_94568:216-500(-)
MPTKGSTKHTLAFNAAASVAAARLSIVPPRQSKSNEPNSVFWSTVVAFELSSEWSVTTLDLGENGAVVDTDMAALLGLRYDPGLFGLLWQVELL